MCVCVFIARRPGVLEEIIHNLDYCDILVLGEELTPGQESLQLQRSALLGKHLDATNSTSGMSIYGRLPWQQQHQTAGFHGNDSPPSYQTDKHATVCSVVPADPWPFSVVPTGVDSMSNYEQVIRQVRYFYWQSRPLIERRFRLTCSELNGRYTSNEFNLEVSVQHSWTDVGGFVKLSRGTDCFKESSCKDFYANVSYFQSITTQVLISAVKKNVHNRKSGGRQITTTTTIS